MHLLHSSSRARIAIVIACVAVLGPWTAAAPFEGRSPSGRVDRTGSMTVARAAHTATLLPSGRVLISGGMNGNGSFLDSAEVYDASTGVFRPTGPMRTARVGHGAVLLRNGRVLVIGGGRGVNRTLAETYDEATGQWQDAGRIEGSFMAALADGTLLLSGDHESTPGLRPTATYDPATGVVTPAGEMMSTLYGPATRLRDGRVLVAGGENDTRMFGDAEFYDPATRKWTRTGSLQIARDKHASTLLADGRVLLVGGSDRRGWNGQMTSTEIYDPTSGVFTAGPNLSSARFKLHASVAALPSGGVVVAGGSTEVESYDPLTNRFAVASGELDAPRFFSSATTLRDGRVLIVGGYTKGDIASTNKAWVHTAR
jgi:hypothetical protein